MSTSYQQTLVKRLTEERLESYLTATGGDVAASIRLYDWNAFAGASLLADLGRLEVLFRNAVDQSLRDYGDSRGWPEPWHRRRALFEGRSRAREWSDIEKAERRAASKQRRSPGRRVKVLTELSFGFWRHLCAARYLTTLWVPAIAAAFPHHPDPGDPNQIRADVCDRMQRLHYLRNLIAHHEPIHRRNLERDHAEMLAIIGWICKDCHIWAKTASRTTAILATRP